MRLFALLALLVALSQQPTLARLDAPKQPAPPPPTTSSPGEFPWQL